MQVLEFEFFEFCIKTTDTEDGICFYVCVTSGGRAAVSKCPVPRGPVLPRHLSKPLHQARYSRSTAWRRSKSQGLLPQAYAHSGIFLLLVLQVAQLLKAGS